MTIHRPLGSPDVLTRARKALLLRCPFCRRDSSARTVRGRIDINPCEAYPLGLTYYICTCACNATLRVDARTSEVIDSLEGDVKAVAGEFSDELEVVGGSRAEVHGSISADVVMRGDYIVTPTQVPPISQEIAR